MKSWLYVAACVLVPALWGAASAWVFRRLRKRTPPETKKGPPPIDYMI